MGKKEIKEEKKDSISWENPEKFICPERIDLIPKILYLKNKENDFFAPFFNHMYLEHIRTFNNFNENHKKCKEDFLNDFDKISNSIKKEGFHENKEPIPSTNDFIAIDGAHRLASSIFHKKNVKIKKIKNSKGPKYNYKYFKKRGINLNVLEEMAYQYLQMKKKNIYVLIFWGSSLKKLNEKEIEKQFDDRNIGVIYSKRIKLTEKGKRNLIISCYENEPWIDKENNFSGALRKVSPCFKGSNEVLFYLLESDKKDKIKTIKKELRDHFGMGNHSLHSSDEYHEARDISSLILNKNSLFFLNHGEKMVLPKELDKDELKGNEHFAVTSSYVMEKFGIRKAGDIDVISNKKDISGLDIDNNYFTEKDLARIIYDPDNFFRFKGLKFLTLKNVKDFKNKRGRSKDKKDALLIEKFLDKKRKFDYKEKIFLIKMKGVSILLKLIKKIPQGTRNNLKENKIIMPIYRRLFA